MIAYKNLLQKVLKQGTLRGNRTGVDCLSLFGQQLRHDMSRGLPILTTKKIYIKGCIHELLWFLKGDTNIKYLVDNDVYIWNAWADENGDLGPVYGRQWIASGKNRVNQVQYVIDEIKNNPLSRRIIIDAWSPSELPEMALPPCHILYQFYVDTNTKRLNLSVYMRSADMFLGVPFDIAEGGLLLSMVAKVTGYTPGEMLYTFGDAHLYVTHIDKAQEQLSRSCFTLPTLNLPHKDSIFDYRYEDFEIFNYKSHNPIVAKVVV